MARDSARPPVRFRSLGASDELRTVLAGRYLLLREPEVNARPLPGGINHRIALWKI